jgi:2,5-diketo-D-gluconate reductase B
VIAPSLAPNLPPPFIPMPRLGLGTWPMRGAECQAAVEAALAMGYRHLDTAEMYGNEAAVGDALRACGLPRDTLFVTTKVWWDKPTGPAIRAATEACIGRLGTHADLLLLHWPSPQLDLPGALEALARLRAEGLATHVGVANFPLGLLRRAVEPGIVPIACVQVEHHVLLGQQRLLDYVTPRGIALTSYTPTAKGEVAAQPAVQGIAKKHGATPTQVGLAALLALPGVAAIPKSASPERQAENLAAATLSLDAADLAALAALPKDRRLIDPAFAPDWAA